MGNKFVPRGYLPFDTAWRLVASLKYGAELAPPLTPEESTEHTSHLLNLKRSKIGKSPSRPEPTPRHIELLTKKLKRYAKQCDAARGELRQHLFSGDLSAWVFTKGGDFQKILQSTWGSDKFSAIVESGKATAPVEGSYSAGHVAGLVLLIESDILALYAMSKDAVVAARAHSKVDPEGAVRSAGGRTPKFQWDDIWIEICRFIYEGFQGSRPELIAKVQEWYQTQHGAAPDSETLKPKIRKLYSRLKLDRK